jgi:hypothetical protein
LFLESSFYLQKPRLQCRLQLWFFLDGAESCKMLVKPVAVVKSVAADLADKLGRQAATGDWRLIYFCNIVFQWRANLCPAICVSMSHKKEIEESLDTEKAKELELDETPKPSPRGRSAALRCRCQTAPSRALMTE